MAIQNDTGLHSVSSLCHICLSQCYLKWHGGYILYCSCVIHVCPLFKMTLGHIPYCPWVIYDCLRAVYNDIGLHSIFSPGSYGFVPGLFIMTLGYISYLPLDHICLSQGYHGSPSAWLFPMNFYKHIHFVAPNPSIHQSTWFLCGEVLPPETSQVKRTDVWKWFTCELDKAVGLSVHICCINTSEVWTN
jgi:hypothetical protein